MIISGWNKTLKVIDDEVEVEADYGKDVANVRFGNIFTLVSIEELDKLTLVLATIAHYAEAAGMHEIGGSENEG